MAYVLPVTLVLAHMLYATLLNVKNQIDTAIEIGTSSEDPLSYPCLLG